MPITSTTKMTATQFLAMGDDPPGVRLELVNGEVAVAPSPTPEHSNADMEFRFILKRHVDENGLGKVLADLDTTLDRLNVRRPDILFFATDRLHLVRRDKLLGPPDLCVEIVSPSSSTVDRVDKFSEYARAGVSYYWILDPIARSLDGFSLAHRKYVPTGGGRNAEVVSLPPFPMLKISLSRLWWATVPHPGKPATVRRRRKRGPGPGSDEGG